MSFEMQTALSAGFVYRVTVRDQGGLVVAETQAPNLYPLEGRNHILSSALCNGVRYGNWFIGLFKGNYTPGEADVINTFPSAAQELVGYVEPSRLTWVPNAVANGSVDSVGNEVVFTMTGDATIYGAFMASSQSKGATNGVLLSAARFPQAQQVRNGQTVTVGAVCALINV
jgi:hypothetical protein